MERFNPTGKCERLGIFAGASGANLDRFQTIFLILPETPEIFPAWRKLVLQYRVSGIKVYDARIAAAMSVHRVPKILTFDREDFNRYEDIGVVHPNSF